MDTIGTIELRGSYDLGDTLVQQGRWMISLTSDTLWAISRRGVLPDIVSKLRWILDLRPVILAPDRFAFNFHARGTTIRFGAQSTADSMVVDMTARAAYFYLGGALRGTIPIVRFGR